jgi:DNA-3-methyladenine glycosylase I
VSAVRRAAPRTAQPIISSERTSRTTVTPFLGKGGGGKASPQRCAWCGDDPLYVAYHDREWGVPVHGDRLLFEFLILEGAQAGLSWITILRKREHYRRAFDDFDAEKVARYGQRQVGRLLGDAGIVRNRLKIEAAINNAQRFLDVQAAFGSFDAYIWRFVDGKPIQNRRKSLKDIPASTPESDALSKDLKARGFKFVGSTICYAHMQATGMVNDHLVDCFRHGEIARRIEP